MAQRWQERLPGLDWRTRQTLGHNDMDVSSETADEERERDEVLQASLQLQSWLQAIILMSISQHD